MTKYKPPFPFIILTLCLLIVSCKQVKDPTEGVKLIINYNLIETTFSIKFLDMKTGELIGKDGQKRVSVLIEGPDAGGIIDISGIQNNPGVPYLSDRGFMELGLDPDYLPGISNPVRFTIVAQSEGYMKASFPVEVIQTGEVVLGIHMINLDDLPDGISHVTDGSGTANAEGELENDLLVITPNNMASLYLKQGSILKNAKGDTLTGSLTVDFTHFSNLEDATLIAYPGGLLNDVYLQDSSIQKVFQFTTGYVSITITDENNQKADSVMIFPMEIAMNLPEVSYNPHADRAIETNDVLQVFRFQEPEKIWSLQTTDTIVEFESTLRVVSQVSHLSYWSWNFAWPHSCLQGTRLNFINPEGYACPQYQWNATFRNSFNGTYMTEKIFNATENQDIVLGGLPGQVAATVNFDALCYPVESELETYTYLDLCDPVVHDVNFHSTQGSMGETVLFMVEGYCENNPNYIVRPSGNFWVRPSGNWCYKWAELEDGYSEVCGLEQDQDYLMGLYFDGHWYEHEFTLNDTLFVHYEMAIPGNVCSVIFGL